MKVLLSRFGDEAWRTICEQAKVDPGGFVAKDLYDDAITYNLVSAASGPSGSSEAVLEAFGEYWTVYTIEEGYVTPWR